MDDIARRHNEKMKRIKEARDKIMATKTEERGLIMVHTGNGKGKSSSGFGMIMRCIAHGIPCSVVQFIKGGWETGEKMFLRERFAKECRFFRVGRGVYMGNAGPRPRRGSGPKRLAHCPRTDLGP